MSDKNCPPLNPDRLWARVEQLASFTQPERPWTRRAFSDLFLAGREWLRQEFERAGLRVFVDEAGNLIGERAGAVPGLKPIVTGSHCDTVMDGGRFDGIIGVLAGIEVAHALNEQGITLQHPFRVVDFLSEEPSDYGVSCVGSRAYAGVLAPDMLEQKNQHGETLAQGIQRIGGVPERLTGPLHGSQGTHAFIELHIEQGPVLETKGLPIGVVTNIVGIRRFRIRITGRPDHAGTTPMDIRKDALVGASQIIAAVNDKARHYLGSDHYVVATIGSLTMTPNAANAVPGYVEMILEVRSDSDAVLEGFADELMAGTDELWARHDLTMRYDQVSRAAPTDCAPELIDLIERSARSLGYPCMRMPSGAGHDAVYMAKTGPVGMIFIPCLNGRSHCPEEWIEPSQLLDGTRVLYQAVLDVDKT